MKVGFSDRPQTVRLHIPAPPRAVDHSSNESQAGEERIRGRNFEALRVDWDRRESFFGRLALTVQESAHGDGDSSSGDLASILRSGGMGTSRGGHLLYDPWRPGSRRTTHGS